MFKDVWYRHPIVKAARHRLGPAWRWKYAGEWLSEELPSSFDQADRYLRGVWVYRRQLLFGSDYGAVTEEFWELFQAAESIQESRNVREELMIMVLGDCLPGDIAEWYGFEEDVIRVWEGVFFDVRDALRATDWLHAHVLEPERFAGNLKCVARLSLAMRGGPKIAKRLLTMGSSPPTDDTERRQVEELQLAMNAWIAVNQPFRSEKDRQQFQRYKQRLDDIECKAQSARESESESERYLLEALESCQFKIGSAFPSWASLAQILGQVAQTDPVVDQMSQG